MLIIIIEHINVFSSRNSILSSDLCLSCCRKFWSFSICGTLAREIRYGHFESSSSLMMEFFTIRFPYSWKLRFYFIPVSVCFLVHSFVFASVSHNWELDAASFWFRLPATSFFTLRAMRTLLTECCDCPRMIWCTRTRYTTYEIRFSVDFDFVIILSSHVFVAFLSTSLRDSWLSWSQLHRTLNNFFFCTTFFFFRSLFLVVNFLFFDAVNRLCKYSYRAVTNMIYDDFES